MTDGPILIGGLSFSGKTAMRRALSAHPRIASTRRTALWERFHERFGDLGRPDNLDRCVTTVLADARVAELGVDRRRLEEDFARGPADYTRLFGLMHAQHAERLGKARWGDQMGMLERHADRVLEALPGSSMIHMIRDPRTRYVAAAERHRRLPGRVGWETARWLRSAELATRNSARHPDRYLVVRYEELAAHPEGTMREVAAFVGEPYDPVMTDALVSGAPGRAEPVVDGAHPHADAWFIERYARSQLAALGYGCVAGRSTFGLLAWSTNRAGLALGRSSADVRGVG